jgi:hypothetical protein
MCNPTDLNNAQDISVNEVESLYSTILDLPFHCYILLQFAQNDI